MDLETSCVIFAAMVFGMRPLALLDVGNEMTTLREAAQLAVTMLKTGVPEYNTDDVLEVLEAALAEPEGGGNLPPPLQEPKDFDHGIGADRFRVVRGAFWWHVLIGDSPTEHGKFRSRASAEKMAADLLREFRNGAFVQHEAPLAEPVQGPVFNPAPGYCKHCKQYTIEEPLPAEPVQGPVMWVSPNALIWELYQSEKVLKLTRTRQEQYGFTVPLYTAPPQRPPLTEEEIDSIWDSEKVFADIYAIARAVEAAHGIK